ncbi:MAG: hypothetical protein K2I23_02805 [Clostridia bacterium]|nr:hypothetical protein [Clostridia bacterium]
MTPTKIIQQLCELVDGKKIVENEEYKKQKKEADKWYEQFDKYIKEDKKLYDIYFHFEMEEGCCDAIEHEIYYREGFICGARLALEICGFSREDN